MTSPRQIIVAALDVPRTATELIEVTSLSSATVHRHLAALHQSKMVHVAKWVWPLTQPMRVWAIGSGNDAKKPAEIPHKERVMAPREMEPSKDGRGVIIRTRKGEEILVDELDFEEVSRYTWHINNRGYAGARYRDDAGEWVYLLMHRLIIDAPDGILVDHANGSTLDNRRINLRLCNEAQNKANSFAQSTNRLGIKGVRKSGDRYHAAITIAGSRRHLGTYDTAEEAKAAYDGAHAVAYGEFSHTARIQYQD